MFHRPTVWQERNQHDLLIDFNDEVIGYLNNAKICEKLQTIKLESGVHNLTENIFRCYQVFISCGFIREEELSYLNAWLLDIADIQSSNSQRTGI